MRLARRAPLGALVVLAAMSAIAVPWAGAARATPTAAPTAPLGAVQRAAQTFPGAWRALPDPFSLGVKSAAIATFGASGVAVVAQGGLIAVSSDAGATWEAHNGPGGAGFDAVAFADSLHGWAAGPPGFLMQTADGGATWAPRYVNGLGAVSALAARGSFVYALGPQGIWASADGGKTWHVQVGASAATGLTSIVAAADGFAMAAGAAGAALTTSGNGTWQASQLPGGNDIVALALAPAPQWNAGVADLFAVSSGGVLASDDEGATFTSLPSPPAGGLLSATVMAGPRPLLLLGRPAASLERFDLTDLSWTKGVGAVAGDIISCAAGPGSIAYALSADGHVACTMSYGDAPASLGTTPTTVTAGDDVNITLSSPIRAPGTLVLESRAVGGRWEELASWPWSTAPSALGDVVDEPLATTRYRVRFVYAGATGATSAGTDVSVRPDIVLLRTSFTLNRGDLYRLAGQVLPAHPGGHVTVWTNRGGPWHRITLGGTLGLVGGSSFRTRLFGTPIRETYRLQIRMTADAGHLAGASAVVKVTIR